MNRIISHLIRKQGKATLDEIVSSESLTVEQIQIIISKYPNVFVVEDGYVTYFPPFDIQNKNSLIDAVEKAFPKGIRQSYLHLCYEFANSDMNELKYRNYVFILKYGKTKEEIYFAARKNSHENIQQLWQKYFNPYTQSNLNHDDLPFPKNNLGTG